MMSFATTYTHTFKSGELKVGTVTLSGTSWTGAGTVGYWGWDSSKGIQIGSKNNPCKSYSLTTSAFADATITEVVVNTSMASSATAKLSISVGGTSYLSNKALTTSAANYTATGAASGDLVISYTNTARAFYIKSITVTYEAKEIEGPKYTVTANVNNPTMGSVTGAGEYGEGATATLTAIPNPAYKFVDWSNGSTDNPLKITVTENIELTANFEALPTMTCAEASVAANGATGVLNPFDVVYAVKGAGYIYIKDESGVALIFDYTLDDQLKAGDHVEGFVGTSSPYNGLPEIKPSVAFEDLTVTSGAAPEPTLFAAAPTKTDVNKYVKFEGVTLSANTTFTTDGATNATMVVNGTNVTLRNAFKLAATLSKDKAYNIVGFVAIYNSSIQVYFLSAEEYVAPEPCTLATPVNWDAPIAAEANTDQWYAVNIASAIAAKKDIALTVANPGAAAVEVTVEAYANCPATEKIAGATSTINAGATKTTTVKYDEYLADQVEVVYLHVVTSGDLTVDAEVIEPCTQATAINWDDAIEAKANTDQWYAVNIASAIAAGKDIELTIANPGTEAVEITAEAYANCPATEKIAGATSTIEAGATKTTTVKYDEYLADQVEVVYFHVVTKGGDLTVGAEAIEPLEIMPIEMTNLEVQDMGEFVLLSASDLNMTGISVMLGVYADGHLHEGSAVDWNGTELPIVEGNITKTVDAEKGDVYAGLVVVEFGEGKMGLDLTMYSAAVEAIEVFASDAEVVINESTGTLEFTTTWEGYPVLVTVAGYEDVEFKEYEGAQISELTIGDDDNWYDFAVANVVAVIKDGNTFSIEGEYTSWATGATYYVMIDGEIPVVKPEKPEPTYTENKLNTYAFGLESELSDDQATLTVTYRLNNSNATAVNVVVYNGTEVVATIPGTTTIGVNTVEVATAELPTGVELTWAVEVNGTSVDAPTREEKIYSFYHPSGVDIDINPENETFGLLLVNEGMQSVASMTEGYVSAGFGAGIFAFTPSFDLVANGELPGYNGGIEFTNTRADGAGTAYAPRRIRISEDGRIFVTSLNTDGNYLWEVNPDNLNEWTTVFKGTLNDQRELVDAEGNFVAAPNNGFDVKGSGENLQLAMYSVNLSGITAAAMSGFRLHEYNLGTATEWATAPTKTLVEGKYAINYTGTQVEYDNEGGFWIASYRGSATDANPGLVHINAEGVEDCKLVWNNVRQAGIRFNKDFTKLVVAGNNGAAKKATIYTISKDANGAPVLTQEAVVDMAVVGNNLNDFAWDYAGNLYACGNSSEKLAAWAMPYSGQVITPAASVYAFQLEDTGSDYEMYEDVITNLVIDYDNMLLIGGPSEAFQVEVVLGLGDYDRNTDAFQLLPASTISVRGSEAQFIDGVASVDGIAQTATAIVHCTWNGMALEFHLTMSATPMEATVVVVENAAIEIEKFIIFGDTYDYSLKMTGVWTNEGIDYPVLVEVPVYYPEATEPYEIYSTVTVGGWGDEDPWLGFGEGYLTITPEGEKITATGVVENPMAGVAIDITISGNINNPGLALDNATVVIKSIKKIQNGQLIIEKDGVQYNAQGAILK